jgi:hypothetical protein
MEEPSTKSLYLAGLLIFGPVQNYKFSQLGVPVKSASHGEHWYGSDEKLLMT